jgi:hypothetical protein
MADLNYKDAKNDILAYLNSSSMVRLVALLPASPRARESIAEIEDLKPDIILYDNGWSQQRDRASAQNLHLTFQASFSLVVGALGSSFTNARDRVRDLVSAIINDLSGSGAFIGTDRSRVFTVVPMQGDWIPSEDDMLQGQELRLEFTFYRH